MELVEEERPGLLSRIGGSLKKFAKNPFVQGIGHAAVIAANPVAGVGLLASRAGSGPGGARERRALENDLKREELRSARRSNDASDELSGLLNQRTRLRDEDPAFLLEGIDGAPGEAVHNFKSESVPVTDTEFGQQKLQGLLSEIAPVQSAASLLGRDPARNPLRMKFEAASEEADRRGLVGKAKDDFIDAAVNGGGTLEELSIRMQMLELEDAKRNATSEAEAESLGVEGAKLNLTNGLNSLLTLHEKNASLSDSALRTGGLAEFLQPLMTVTTGLQRFAGMDVAGQEQTLADFDIFTKEANNLLLDILPSLQGINAGTDSRLATIQKTLANTSTEPGANAMIIAKGMQDFLDIADLNQNKFGKDFIKNRAEIEALIKQIKTAGKSMSPRTVTMPNGQRLLNVPPGVTDEQAIARAQAAQ